MKLWNISEAKANLSAMIERVSRGEEIIIGKAGKPVARLVPYVPARNHRRLGLFSGKIKLAPDFDQWPDEIARKLGISHE